jgi:hypothetical protein
VQRERFDDAVAALRREFPNLIVEVTHSHPHVDASADFPVQPGLQFEVAVSLQNGDELHLACSQLWVEWFPCSRQEVFEGFLEAASGILSGRCRIVESYVLSRPASARLEAPGEDGRWRTLAKWSSLWAFVPWLRRQRIVCNKSGSSV